MSVEWWVVSAVINVLVVSLAYWLGYQEGRYQERRRALRTLTDSPHLN